MSSKLYRAEDTFESTPFAFRCANAPMPVRGHAAQPGDDSQARLEAARQEGFAAAEAAAAKRAADRVAPALASFSGIVQELAGLRAHIRKEAEEDAVKLAIAIARRILQRELTTDPEAILGLVKAAFQKLNLRETHRVRLAPGDVALLQANRARLEIPASVEIVADPSLVAGSAVFETSRGEMDASVGTQLAEIERGFADLMRRK